MAANQMMMFSLDNSERQIAFALQEGGVLIFYSHRMNSFDWFNQEDEAQIDRELTNLRAAFCDRRITAVSAGESMTVNGIELHTMLVNFGIPCGPYMLLRRRGLMEDTDHTPYFFKSRARRDRAIDFITAPRTGGG